MKILCILFFLTPSLALGDTQYHSTFNEVKDYLICKGHIPTFLQLSEIQLHINIPLDPFNLGGGEQIRVLSIDPGVVGTMVIYIDKGMDGTVDETERENVHGSMILAAATAADQAQYKSIITEFAKLLMETKPPCSKYLKA